MKKTRERILRTLLSHPDSTINDLADAVGINGISIRHHLTNLEAEGLVISAEERHGVGRPRLIYSLTEKGAEIFPTSYLRLTKHLLKNLQTRLSHEEIIEMMEGIGEDIVNANHNRSREKSIEARIKSLRHILSREGFILEWENTGNQLELSILSCPYLKVGLDHPYICSIDHKVITKVLNKPVKTKTCILKGDEHCTFQLEIIDKDVHHE